MRIAELSRPVPLPRDRIPRHGEVALVPAEDDGREQHDAARGGEREGHEEDVQVHEAEPVEQRFAEAVTAVAAGGEGPRSLERVAAVGRRGRGLMGRVAREGACGDWRSPSVREVGCVRDGRCWAGTARAVGRGVGGCALGAWVRRVAARDAVEKVEGRHCGGGWWMLGCCCDAKDKC